MPMGEYKDFDACLKANSDKDNPSAYCGTIKAKTERVIYSSGIGQEVFFFKEVKTAMPTRPAGAGLKWNWTGKTWDKVKAQAPAKKQGEAPKQKAPQSRAKELENHIRKVQKALDNEDTSFDQHSDLLAELDSASDELKKLKQKSIQGGDKKNADILLTKLQTIDELQGLDMEVIDIMKTPEDSIFDKMTKYTIEDEYGETYEIFVKEDGTILDLSGAPAVDIDGKPLTMGTEEPQQGGKVTNVSDALQIILRDQGPPEAMRFSKLSDEEILKFANKIEDAGRTPGGETVPTGPQQGGGDEDVIGAGVKLKQKPEFPMTPGYGEGVEYPSADLVGELVDFVNRNWKLYNKADIQDLLVSFTDSEQGSAHAKQVRTLNPEGLDSLEQQLDEYKMQQGGDEDADDEYTRRNLRKTKSGKPID